ncbi:MAG: hypothetical protein FJ217_05660 [Ignavibacteria bacterium]|nr:hypothetical protein [Ignavibacteria bacterium]
MRLFRLLTVLSFGALLLYAASGLPDRGDPDAPPHRVRSIAGSLGAAAYYIQHAQSDANTPNIVTVILADYRSYDTLGEATVIFTAGIICFLLLKRQKV